jgi:hypothetical protein
MPKADRQNQRGTKGTHSGMGQKVKTLRELSAKKRL